MDVAEGERVCEDIGAFVVCVEAGRWTKVAVGFGATVEGDGATEVMMDFVGWLKDDDNDGDGGVEAEEVICDRGEPSRGYIFLVVWDGTGTLWGGGVGGFDDGTEETVGVGPLESFLRRGDKLADSVGDGEGGGGVTDFDNESVNDGEYFRPEYRDADKVDDDRLIGSEDSSCEYKEDTGEGEGSGA